MYRTNHNAPQSAMTANPKKYPQGFFKDKLCRECENSFKPMAPSHLYCSQECADRSATTAYLKRCYGINLRDYESMLSNQNSLCAICKEAGFLMKDCHQLRLVVDHCHATGVVRGLLCHNCNRALGLLKDSQKSIEAALNYLKGAETIRKEYASSEAEAPSPQVI